MPIKHDVLTSSRPVSNTVSVDVRSRVMRVSGGNASGCQSHMAAIKGPLHNRMSWTCTVWPRTVYITFFFFSRPELWSGTSHLGDMFAFHSGSLHDGWLSGGYLPCYWRDKKRQKSMALIYFSFSDFLEIPLQICIKFIWKLDYFKV